MPGKRSREDTIEAASYSEHHNTTQSRPQKRRKQDATITDTTYTVAQILAFKDSISNIKDWTSNKVDQKHVQVIYWFDVEGLSKTECAERYPNKHGKPCLSANIFKMYNTYAPRFYAEKGLTFIPLGKRVVGRAPVRKPAASAPHKKGFIERRLPVSKRPGAAAYKASQLDHELTQLFHDLPQAAVLPALAEPYRCTSEHGQDVEGIASREEMQLITAVDFDQDMMEFKCQVGEISYGCSETIKIRRACAVQYCQTVREALQRNSNIHVLQYGPEFNADTVARFVACCSPTLQSSLPTHVTTSFNTFEQEWTMLELQDLYVFAVSMGAPEVCDMIIDRWHQEMRRPEQRVVHDEFGNAHTFGILEFGPELLSFLQKNDEKGFDFFLNVLITHGPAGYNLLCDTHLGNWHRGVKKALIVTMESGSATDLVAASPEIICRNFHHHNPDDEMSCYKRQAHLPPLQSAVNTLSTSSHNTNLDQKDEDNILQITVPNFPWVHNRYPRSGDNDDMSYLVEYIPDRLRGYRNTHQEDRMRYANPKFNAHHDTKDVCEEKLRMVKEKVGLFIEAGIRLSDEEVETAFGTSQKAPGVDNEDEDEDDGSEEE